MKTRALCLLLLLTLSLPGITLQEAVERGKALSHRVTLKKIDEEGASLGLDNARYARLFTVAFGSSFTAKSDFPELSLSLPSASGTPLNIQRTLGSWDSYDARVALSQPLWTGGTLTSLLRKSEREWEAARWDRKGAEREAASLVKGSFYLYRMLRAKEENLGQLVERLRLHRKRLELLLKEKQIRRSDLLETDARINENLLNLEETRELKDQEALRFQRLCDISPESIEGTPSEREWSLQEALSLYRENHPLFRSLEKRREAWQYQKRAVEGLSKPQLALFTELHFGKPGLNSLQNRGALYALGGIALTFPLFQWNRSKRDSRIAELGIERTTNSLEERAKDVEETLRQTFRALESVNKRLELTQELVLISRQDLLLKERLYREAQLPHLDYLGALTAEESRLSQKEALSFLRESLLLRIDALVAPEPEA